MEPARPIYRVTIEQLTTGQKVSVDLAEVEAQHSGTPPTPIEVNGLLIAPHGETTPRRQLVLDGSGPCNESGTIARVHVSIDY